MDRNTHWNNCYIDGEKSALGWQEKDQSQTKKFIDQVPITTDTRAFIAGAGTSELADELAERVGCLILNDISDVALSALEKRLKSSVHQRLLHDLGTEFSLDKPIDLWIDRAVLHFLLSEQEILQYFENINKNMGVGGYVLLAQFSNEGANRCAGLDVHRYSLKELVSRMGTDFELMSFENHCFINPYGNERPYVYALFKRKSG